MSPNKTKSVFTIADLEAQIFDLERIRVMFRAPADLRVRGVAYGEAFTNATPKNKPVTALCNRIDDVLRTLENDLSKGALKDFDTTTITYQIVDGSGNYPTKLTHSQTVRASYNH